MDRSTSTNTLASLPSGAASWRVAMIRSEIRLIEPGGLPAFRTTLAEISTLRLILVGAFVDGVVKPETDFHFRRTLGYRTNLVELGKAIVQVANGVVLPMGFGVSSDKICVGAKQRWCNWNVQLLPRGFPSLRRWHDLEKIELCQAIQKGLAATLVTACAGPRPTCSL